MNEHNMLPHGDTSICQIWYTFIKEQRGSCPDNHLWLEYNFEFGTKYQVHTEVMNICDTSPFGDTLTCHIWYDYAKG